MRQRWWIAAGLASVSIVLIAWLRLQLDKRLSTGTRGTIEAPPCSDPSVPGCSRCILRREQDGSAFVLEGNEYGYSSGTNQRTVPADLRPCASCRLEHRLTLQRLAAQTECDEVDDEDAGYTKRRVTVDLNRYCSRFATAPDFGLDPTFHAGSCVGYCWLRFVARFHCPD